MPQDYAEDVSQPLPAAKSATTSSNRIQKPRTITRSENITLTFLQTSRDWTKANEKEFRRLALKEAAGQLSEIELRRLNRMSKARDQQSSPLSAEEVLLQIRRDRILEKMADLLEEYVEFTESTGNQGTAAA